VQVAAVGAALVVAAVLALALALWSGDAAGEDASPPPEPTVVAGALDAAPTGARVLVRAVDPDAPRADGRLYQLAPGEDPRRVARLACKRVHAVSGGPALCLTLAPNLIDYDGVVLDDDYRGVVRFPIDGVPDRARVSPDGRHGAYTSFDSAGSVGYFESSDEFVTFTRIVDMRTGAVIQRLEDLVVTRGRKRMDLFAPQYCGVTFAGEGRYYATLASGQDHFLVEGEVGSGRARVVRGGVECPSLSPDGGRIAYKRRIGTSNRWRLHVLDLETGEDVALAEERSVDDQPEWLGDESVAYSDDEDLLVVPADGGGAPRRVAEAATSPAYLPP
jgi:hypothetical protein